MPQFRVINDLPQAQALFFRSVPALRAQNLEAIVIIRELGANMEAEEHEHRETLETMQSEAVREADEAIIAPQEQFEANRTISNWEMRSAFVQRARFSQRLSRTCFPQRDRIWPSEWRTSRRSSRKFSSSSMRTGTGVELGVAAGGRRRGAARGCPT